MPYRRRKRLHESQAGRVGVVRRLVVGVALVSVGELVSVGAGDVVGWGEVYLLVVVLALGAELLLLSLLYEHLLPAEFAFELRERAVDPAVL